jgi:DNA-binding response OmpR family regulator
MIAAEPESRSALPVSRHVLIVDDEVDSAYPLNRALTMKGFRVTHATDGNQGLAVIEQDPPDLVLLDIMLPGRGGLLVLEAVREKTDFTAPIVMLTGIDADRHRDYALTLGAASYITKPYAMSKMISLVEELTDLKANGPN